QILGNMALSVPSFIKLGGDALEGAIFTTSYLGEEVSKTSKLFVENYKNKYGDDPTFFAAFAYDGVGLIASSLNSPSDVSGNFLLAKLSSITNYDGATGTLSVGTDRKIRFPTRMVQVKSGKIIPLQ
ncbi:MAG: ABC transporter substrate-binding protein, partial [Candidatus Methylumidiphilus sp.]